MSKSDYLKYTELSLSDYREDCRYLKEVHLEGKKAWGKFSIDTTCYTVASSPKCHLNAVELVLTYNQLVFSLTSNLFINGMYDLPQIPINVFFPELFDERMLIAKFDAKFNKLVKADEFTGTISIDKIVKRNDLYFLYTSYLINSGAHSANVLLAADLRGLELEQTHL